MIYKVEANGKQYALKAFNERHEKLRETEVRAVQALSKTNECVPLLAKPVGDAPLKSSHSPKSLEP